MTVDFENLTNTEFEFDACKIAKDVITEACKLCHLEYEPSVHLMLVNEEDIHRINLEYREIDRPTDVLSFPMISYEKPEIMNEDDLIAQDAFDPDSGELILGDILICVERVFAQAEEYGHSVMREYGFLIAHSMLHLFGYDHMTEEEAAVMEEKQETVLQNLNILRNQGGNF